MKGKILLVLTGLLLFVLILQPVYAQEGSEGGRLNHPDLRPNFLGSDSGKLRVCEIRKEFFVKRHDQIGRLAQVMFRVFQKIAARVEEFYTTKLVPQGKTLTNYDALVADINAKKLLVDAAVVQTQTDGSNFQCNTASSSADLALIQTDVKKVKQALKDYRTSVRNLIVAVRHLVGGDNDKNATGSGQTASSSGEKE